MDFQDASVANPDPRTALGSPPVIQAAAPAGVQPMLIDAKGGRGKNIEHIAQEVRHIIADGGDRQALDRLLQAELEPGAERRTRPREESPAQARAR